VRYVKRLKKGSGLYFYYRRIPKDLRDHYSGKLHRRVSLGTSDPSVAIRKAKPLAEKDDAWWKSLRSQEAKDLGLTAPETREAAHALLEQLGLSPGDLTRNLDGFHPVDVLDPFFERRYGEAYLRARHDQAAQPFELEALYSPVEKEALRLLKDDPRSRRVHLSEAVEAYLAAHKRAGNRKFVTDTRRAIGQVIAAAGDLPLTEYRRVHAKAVCDHLLKRGVKTATVRRNINIITAVFNEGIREFDLRDASNPFERLRIRGEGEDAQGRQSFTTEELRSIAAACRQRDDDIRHLIALQADTGARLGEIVGLRIEDVLVDHRVPHVWIRPHEKLGHTLKTPASKRKVPLVGIALWGAQRALEAQSDATGGWLFPRYAADNNLKATHASNTINKWLRQTTKTAKTSHSFRHTMRDRLRHVAAPKDIQDAIGGWGTPSIGEGYGSEGYLLEQLHTYLAKVALAHP
jgi:integrase